MQVNSYDAPTVSEVPLPSDSKREIPKLSLQIPIKPVIFAKFQDGEGSLQSLVSSKGAASLSGNFLRGFSFKNRSKPPDAEKSHLLNSNPEEVARSPTLPRGMSKFKSARCSSLPGPAFESPPSITTPASARTTRESQRSYRGSVSKNMSRTFSVPGRNVVIVRSPSLVASKGHNMLDLLHDDITPVSPVCDNDEEIPEEEAICRICFEACEERQYPKDGWFSTRRNKNCDVCGQEVQNLPVTLLRVASASQGNDAQEQNRHAIQDLKTRAIVIAAPFAFSLGLVASVLAVLLAIKEYIWTFAAVEFAFIAIILCLLYNVLHLNPVYSLLLSSILGFSITLSLNSIYIHMFYWRVSAVDNSSNV
ncbi:Elongation factor 4 [Bienertia sinuspersici]